MTLPASGTITLAQIAAEFGGAVGHSLSEYYRGGPYIPNTPAYSAVPTSGSISLSNFYGLSAFTPVTNTYNSGSGTENVPSGATTCVITVWGAGGSGRRTTTATVGGGGGGGYVQKTISVSGGQTIAYSVGAGGAARTTTSNGVAGGSSTVNTWSGGSLSLTAGGGAGGTIDGGAGGSASGGDTNTTGGAGTQGTYETFDAFWVVNPSGGSSPNGGGGGPVAGTDGSAPGGGGAGNRNANSGAGAAGRITFAYT